MATLLDKLGEWANANAEPPLVVALFFSPSFVLFGCLAKVRSSDRIYFPLSDGWTASFFFFFFCSCSRAEVGNVPAASCLTYEVAWLTGIMVDEACMVEPVHTNMTQSEDCRTQSGCPVMVLFLFFW